MTISSYTITLDAGSFTTDGSTSILDAALTQGTAVPFSCQRGECGSCLAQVVAGRHARIAPANEKSYVTADDELLMCQCRAASDLTLRFPHWRASSAARRSARVASRTPLTGDITQLIVELQGNEPFDHQPGQHVQLVLADGQRRSFSIANVRDTADPQRLEFHIRRTGDTGFTGRILPGLTLGDTLELDGPHGSCTWPPHDRHGISHVVLLATGTGYAGVFPVMMAALQDPDIESVTLYWGNRTQDDCHAAPLLDALQGKRAGLSWCAVLSRDGQPDTARTAYVQDVAAAADHDWSRTVVYACGNGAMVRAARQRLLAEGLPAHRFLAEAFVPAASPVMATQAPAREPHPWERVGQQFTMAGILDARERSIAAVHEIAALMTPGLTTRQAITLADAHLRRMGASNNWHPTYVRFGPDTQSPPVQPTDFQRVLQDDDIVVVDIGPVWNGYEGDYGDTFVMGAGHADRQRCAQAAREVFRLTRQDWLRGLSGIELYERADQHARAFGCALVHEIPGHRVSEFPHALYGKHRLSQADFAPSDGIWVLEIQVRDQHLPIGAFYEDVLMRD